MHGTKLCIACYESIEAEASVCSRCGSFQKRWMNNLRYWSGITGLVALAVSGLTFSINLADEIYRNLTRTAVVVTEFDSFGTNAIWNTTSRDLVITYVRVQADEPEVDLQLPLQKIARPDQPLRFVFHELVKQEWHGSMASMYSGESTGDYALSLSAQDLVRLKRNEMVDQFVLSFLHRLGPEFAQLNELYKDRLKTVSCEGSIGYREGSTDVDRTVTFPCVGVFRTRKLL